MKSRRVGIGSFLIPENINTNVAVKLLDFRYARMLNIYRSRSFGSFLGLFTYFFVHFLFLYLFSYHFRDCSVEKKRPPRATITVFVLYEPDNTIEFSFFYSRFSRTSTHLLCLSDRTSGRKCPNFAHQFFSSFYASPFSPHLNSNISNRHLLWNFSRVPVKMTRTRNPKRLSFDRTRTYIKFTETAKISNRKN